MTVYTVEYLYYEETFIIGIYKTKELAIKAIEKLEKENENRSIEDIGTYCWSDYEVIEK